MNKLFLAAVVTALCGVPTLSRAEAPGVPHFLAAPERDAHAGNARRSDEAAGYAAREKAASPLLAEFSGGATNGIYIGTGALVIALVIVILLLAL